MKKLVTKVYRQAKKIIIALDNLNTHSKKSLIAAFGKKAGEKLNRKIELHFTPKHASWLNQAELEIHSLSTQCLKRRIPTFQKIQKETAAWVKDRNEKELGSVGNLMKKQQRKNSSSYSYLISRLSVQGERFCYQGKLTHSFHFDLVFQEATLLRPHLQFSLVVNLPHR